jgi:hypothetical protein
MKTVLAFGALGLGIAMLVLSTLWSSIFPATSNWTAEKSTRHTEVQARLSNLGPIVNSPKPASMHRGQDLGTLKAEFDSLVKENEQLNAEFVAARDNPKRASSFLKWTGIGLAVIGLIGFYAVKQTS